MLYPPELRGHMEYQLVTIIFFSLHVKLHQLCLEWIDRNAILPRIEAMKRTFPLSAGFQTTATAPSPRRFQQIRPLRSHNS